LLLCAYRALVVDFGESSEAICPSLGAELKSNIGRIEEELAKHHDVPGIAQTRESMGNLLRSWAKKAARYYEDKAGEMRDLLLVMARTAESLGNRDEEFARQLDSVTAQLETIASLDDLSKMRSSLQESTRQLKNSVARLSSENKSVIDHLRVEVLTYEAKLEKANHLASCDPLTGLGSRVWIEAMIQQRLDAGSSFCVLMIDIVEFRRVNDDFGRMVGDMVMKEFARELRSSCRFSNLLARWSGDTFIVVLDAGQQAAIEQAKRLHGWLNKQYAIPGRAGLASIRLDASISCVECRDDDTVQEILERADAALNDGGQGREQRKRA
jgi:diguanylate cyclase